MSQTINAKRPLSPRLAGAIFFAIYALLFTLFAKYTLLSLRDSALLPLLPACLTALITGAFAGSLFGETLAKKAHWSRSLLSGILLACLSLLLGTLAILTYHYLNNASFFSNFHRWQDYLLIYGAILLSLVLTIGVWLIPLTGLIAIYFNNYFLPGLMAIDQKRLQSENQPVTKASNDEEV
ncbi:hypothetical protein [Legionella fairfieldensis]|uniref:hypothetical protein n=1 Tax=Legionella fairfieldensis TaxID=45064 RepID=UPI00048BB625|nr:hypothetical protein [Legionella fairfieldensis]